MLGLPATAEPYITCMCGLWGTVCTIRLRCSCHCCSCLCREVFPPSAAMEAMMQATDADMMAVPLCSSEDIYLAEMMIAHHKVLSAPC